MRERTPLQGPGRQPDYSIPGPAGANDQKDDSVVLKTPSSVSGGLSFENRDRVPVFQEVQGEGLEM